MERGEHYMEEVGGTHVTGKSSADSWDFKIQVQFIKFQLTVCFIPVHNMPSITCMRAAVFIYTDNTFGAGSGPVLIEYVNCNGNEASLSQCGVSNIYNYNDHNSAALKCENYPINKGKC